MHRCLCFKGKNLKSKVSFISVIGFLSFFVSFTIQADNSSYQSDFEVASTLSQSQTEADLNEAEQKWKVLLEAYPNDLAAANNLAVTQMKQKKYDEAQKELEAALNADPKIAVILENLNQIYAYQAQLAYQSVFKTSEMKEPKGQWIALSSEQIKTPDQAKLEKLEQELKKVVNLVENWRAAWAGQDYDGYVQFYANDFVTEQYDSHKTWLAGRKYSVTQPDFIKVSLNDIEVLPFADNLIEVSFNQTYESNRFKDTVKKQLIWQNKKAGWKIVKERVVHE